VLELGKRGRGWKHALTFVHDHAQSNRPSWQTFYASIFDHFLLHKHGFFYFSTNYFIHLKNSLRPKGREKHEMGSCGAMLYKLTFKGANIKVQNTVFYFTKCHLKIIKWSNYKLIKCVCRFLE
jgi:hypothetical protein